MDFIIKPSKFGKLDSAHLSKGERDGLKQHEVTPEMFDKMDEVSQREWVEELDMDSYREMRNFHKKSNYGLKELLTKKNN